MEETKVISSGEQSIANKRSSIRSSHAESQHGNSNSNRSKGIGFQVDTPCSISNRKESTNSKANAIQTIDASKLKDTLQLKSLQMQNLFAPPQT